MERVFLLFDKGGNHRVGAAILPEPTDTDKVLYEWTYAIRYSADGLDLPNYEKAMKLLQDRNQTWEVIPGKVASVSYTPRVLDENKKG